MIYFLKNIKYLHVIRVNKKIEKSFLYDVQIRSRSTTNYSNDKDDYEYIQKSNTPTMHFQPSLPRLPIPKLEDSCRRYLNAQQPILSDEEWKQTSAYVSEFLTKDGPRLQKLLLAQDATNKHTSYISELWFHMYLKDRKPLPINYNPMLVFTQETDPKYNTPLVKSTNLLISSGRFMKSLRAGILEPEVFHLDPKKSDTKFFRTFTGFLPSSIATYGAYLFKAFPLDMSQYSNLFGTTRIPKIGKDTLFHDDTSRHVIVMHKGHFYSMDLLDNNGKILKPLEIASSLNAIINDTRETNSCPIGILTTTDRDQWAKTRQHLLDLGNEAVLKKIDSAAFVFIIDNDCVEADQHKLIRLFLHGDGTNRWFDKSFSLIMTGDGVSGINFEHSWGDGVAVLRYFKNIKHDITDKPRFHPDDVVRVSNNAASVERIDFVVDDFIKETVNQVSKEYNEWTSDRLTVDYLICEEFGKEECKNFGISPDAVMQLAFQLALYKREARSVATYESCSTSAFRHGRTETVRSCTNETKALCSAIVGRQGSTQVSDSELRKLMVECSKVHNTLVKEAAMGQGFDRHLFVLQNLWEKSKDDGIKPAIFTDPAYAKINHNILSTSTLSSPEVAAGGFGPVVEDGYGIGYMIQDHRLGSVVTSYRKHRDATDYVHYLKSAFEDIHRILKCK